MLLHNLTKSGLRTLHIIFCCGLRNQPESQQVTIKLILVTYSYKTNDIIKL